MQNYIIYTLGVLFYTSSIQAINNPEGAIVSAKIVGDNTLQNLCGGTSQKLDGILILFKDKLLPNTVTFNDFELSLANGKKARPTCVVPSPNNQYELLLVGDFDDLMTFAPQKITVVGDIFTRNDENIRGAVCDKVLKMIQRQNATMVSNPNPRTLESPATEKNNTGKNNIDEANLENIEEENPVNENPVVKKPEHVVADAQTALSQSVTTVKMWGHLRLEEEETVTTNKIIDTHSSVNYSLPFEKITNVTAKKGEKDFELSISFEIAKDQMLQIEMLDDKGETLRFIDDGKHYDKGQHTLKVFLRRKDGNTLRISSIKDSVIVSF
jgi:hypothetical protein